MESISTLGAAVDDIAGYLLVALVAVLVVLLIRRYATRPQVVVDAIECDKKLCPSNVLSAVLISEISTIGAGRRLERVADTSSASTVDFAALAGDRAKWLAALLQFASLRRRVRVSGIAFEANEHEVGVNVSVTGTRNVVVASRAFTNKAADKNTKVLLRELIFDAASWTQFELDRVLRNKPRRNLGTSDWRSWGRFRTGWWRDTQEMPDARDAYSEAVEFDPDNWGAWINFGSLDVRSHPARALRRLETAEQLITRESEPEREPAYYQLLYVMGVVHLKCSLDREQLARRDEHRVRAVDAATRLVTLSATTRLRLKQGGKLKGTVLEGAAPETRDDLESTLALVQPNAIALLTSARVNAGCPIGGAVEPSTKLVTAAEWIAAQERLERVTARSTPHELLALLGQLMTDEQFPPGADYNLACMYARAVASQNDGVDHGMTRAELVDAALRHLARSVESSARRKKMAPDDPAFKVLSDADPTGFAEAVGGDATRATMPDTEIVLPSDGEEDARVEAIESPATTGSVATR
jgi:hypothetical protein